MAGKFVLTKGSSGKYHFNLLAGNGQTIAGAISTVLLVMSVGVTVAFKRVLRLDRVVAHD